MVRPFWQLNSMPATIRRITINDRAHQELHEFVMMFVILCLQLICSVTAACQVRRNLQYQSRNETKDGEQVDLV